MNNLPSLVILFSMILFSPTGARSDAIESGKDVFFSKCLSCHAFTCNKQGPTLGDLFGRKVGTVRDYGYYSDGLLQSDVIWTETTLDGFLADPKGLFPESVMARFGRVEEAEDRQNLIAFLKTEDPSINICPN